jgi:hypothetical protein
MRSAGIRQVVAIDRSNNGMADTQRTNDSATFCGSSASKGNGFPERVLQNLQERVQISPPIIKVAVR